MHCYRCIILSLFLWFKRPYLLDTLETSLKSTSVETTKLLIIVNQWICIIPAPLIWTRIRHLPSPLCWNGSIWHGVHASLQALIIARQKSDFEGVAEAILDNDNSIAKIVEVERILTPHCDVGKVGPQRALAILVGGYGISSLDCLHVNPLKVEWSVSIPGIIHDPFYGICKSSPHVFSFSHSRSPWQRASNLGSFSI